MSTIYFLFARHGKKGQRTEGKGINDARVCLPLALHSFTPFATLSPPFFYAPSAAHLLPALLVLGEGVVLVPRHERHVRSEHGPARVAAERQVFL